MARNKPSHASHSHDQSPQPQWDDSGWDHDQDDAACQRAKRLLSRRAAGWHGIGDRFNVMWRWLRRERWLRHSLIGVSAFVVMAAVVFGGLWLRLGAGPINLDMATPWLASAIEDNIGQGNTVEVGGTQIERVGRIRVAVRIRDIVVRDRDHVIVASAPKAEVRLSGMAIMMGRLRAESLNLVDAELSVRITPDGRVTVSTGDNARPLATGSAAPRPFDSARTVAPNPAPPNSSTPEQAAPSTPGAAVTVPPAPDSSNGLLAGLDWLDSLSLTGLDGQNLNEIGLKNGSLVIDDQQLGNKFSFDNITLSLRRPSSGGVAMSVGEEGTDAWSLRVLVGAPTNGVRSIEIAAKKLSTLNILRALRVKDLTYSADLPLTGDLKGEIGRDGLPTFFRGKLTAGAGNITDSDTPDYPMGIDAAEFNIEWDSARRVLLAPLKIISGENRITLLASLEAPNDAGMPDWRLGFSGGTILLAGAGNEQPLIFNRIAIGVRFDTRAKRVMVSQFDISNGEIGVAGTAAVDYAGEPRLTLGFAGTPMSASALKRMWPVLIVPEVREWVLERIDRGSLQRIDIAVNSPVKNLSRRGPPIPDEGLNVNMIASGVALRPVDELPLIRDADMRVRVTGRTATVTIGQAGVDTPNGRKLNLSDIVFEVPDMVPKPAPAKIRLRIDGPVPAAAEILASDRLGEFTGNLLDPATTKGNVTAQLTLGLPIKRELTKADTIYTVVADLNGFSADKLVMNQKLEASGLKVLANNAGFQVRGDVKINGQAATLDYRKPNDADADVRLQATLDDAARARLGVDLGTAVTGALPIKLIGKIGAPDRESKLGIEADLTQLRLDNLLPGWTKAVGKPGKAVFNVVQKPQSTRFEDIVIDGGGVSIKGSLEVDQNGDPINANFPVYSPSAGDKSAIKADRGADGVVKVTVRGDVFDGSGFIKYAMSGKEPDGKGKSKTADFDLDVKLGVVAGYYGETVRGLDVKASRRGGNIRSFSLAGKLGRDTPLTGSLRDRAQGRDVLYVETNDAGAFFRFTDTYAKMFGGQLALAMDPPTSDTSRAREGLINVRDFQIKGEQALESVAQRGANGQQSSLAFSRLRAEFSRQNGQLSIREGVVKGPSVGATIEGSIDYPANQVRMSGTFVPVYGLNSIPGQIPLLGMFLGGSNEGLFGVTYEVIGTPAKPEMRVNPISAMAPGVLRKIFEFNTGKQNNQVEFPNSNN